MKSFCTRCGSPNDVLAQFCSNCQMALPSGGPEYRPLQTVNAAPPVNWKPFGADKKLSAGLCGILLGSLGVHKFILGYQTEGIIMLLVTVLSCGIALPVTAIIGIVESIVYLTRTDEEFVRTYIQGKKGWF